MALLAGVAYDPGTAVSKSCASLLAMTAIDTTNLRLTFTAPANGTVLVRLRCILHGSTAMPMVMLGVLDGATIRGRAYPSATRAGGTSGVVHYGREAIFVVTGLTPSTSYTWDAAYGVEVVHATTALKYGGPNNTNTAAKFGAFTFEVWETTNLLAGTLYDPGTAATSSLATATALTAIDTTNLRLTFTPPASGNALVRVRAAGTGATGTPPALLFGVLSGSTVMGRASAVATQAQTGTAAASDVATFDSEFIVTGLSGSQTWDAAVSVDSVLAGYSLKWGGPDNTTGDDAWGGFAFEVWTA